MMVYNMIVVCVYTNGVNSMLIVMNGVNCMLGEWCELYAW